MPSTKRPRKIKTKSSSSENNTTLVDFKRKVGLEMTKIRRAMEKAVSTFKDQIDMTVSQMPTSYLDMKLYDIVNFTETPPKGIKNNEADILSTMKKLSSTGKKGKRFTQASDDGYATGHSEKAVSTMKVKKTPRVSIAKKVKTRVSVVKRTSARISKQRAVMELQTPANRTAHRMEPITPKICPNTPMNVFRRPKRGEVVLSMGGSPLMVTTTVDQENTMNINMPLNNGTVLSLVPNGDLRQSMIPSNLSPSTISQIKTLRNYLDQFIEE